MEGGARVWVRDRAGEQAWIEGKILSRTAGTLSVEVDEEFSEEPLTFPISEADGIELEDVKLANDEEMDTVDDLIQLPHLHEAAILHSLTQRFEAGHIYTFTANAILLAVNPFKDLPLYGKELLQKYCTEGESRSQGMDSASVLAPHVFAIADSSYRDMMQGIQAGAGGAALGPVNQSILISGESGAGKTESTKHVMKYLTTVGSVGATAAAEVAVSKTNSSSSSSSSFVPEGSVMDRVLQSNPILEAFGNARTIRNDNSSRFGKFIELLFDKQGRLLGAAIETYLLEKVRIPTQSENERNFHLFYQMTKGANDEERARWALESPEEYHYSNQGDCYDLSRVEDDEEFQCTKKAMQLMGFSPEDQESIFSLVASLLHMGQLEFESSGSDESACFASDEQCQSALAHACRLACLPQQGLQKALTEKTIEIGARNEVHTIKLQDRQAFDARDALAKAIYGQLFDHIVASINANINCSRKDVRASVGVLDIFGFECFAQNTFEQLCINYTNETLQQQFNQFVFKMEQKEYTREGIEWSFIEFPDNQDCLDLIEGKPQGLLAMLDDECRMGSRGSDKNYASRLYKEHSATARFSADAPQQTKLKFALKHYAGEVVYNVETFCDKNRDELPKESNELFASSTSPFLQKLFGTAGGSKGSSSSSKKGSSKGSSGSSKKRDSGSGETVVKKPTVGTQFKEQLHNLMAMIRDTRPHYIRCVKPNDSAQPDNIHRCRVMEQLRYGGVLEAVRVARSGFPVRLPHKEFYGRYRPLLALLRGESGKGAPVSASAAAAHKAQMKKFPINLKAETADSARKRCEELVKTVLVPVIAAAKSIPSDTIQFGKTKVFLRKNAYDALEMLRSRRLVDAAITTQALCRGFVYRRNYNKQRRAVINLQRVMRGMIARKHAHRARRRRAATRVQTGFRRHSAQRKYKALKRAVNTLQCRQRGTMARAVYLTMRREAAAKRLQAWGRMAPARRKHVKARSAVVSLQCAQRRKIAKATVKRARAAAKDVGNLKADNEKLKAELSALKASSQQAIKEAQAAAGDAAATAAATAEAEALKKRVAELETELQTERSAVAELQQEAEGLRTAAAASAAAAAAAAEALRAELSTELSALQTESAAAAAEAETQSAELRAQIAELSAQTSAAPAAAAAVADASSSNGIREGVSLPALEAAQSAAAAAEVEVAVLRGQVEDLQTGLAAAEKARMSAEEATREALAALAANGSDVKPSSSSSSSSKTVTAKAVTPVASDSPHDDDDDDDDEGPIRVVGGGEDSFDELDDNQSNASNNGRRHDGSGATGANVNLGDDDLLIHDLMAKLEEEKQTRRQLQSDNQRLQEESVTLQAQAAKAWEERAIYLDELEALKQNGAYSNGDMMVNDSYMQDSGGRRSRNGSASTRLRHPSGGNASDLHSPSGSIGSGTRGKLSGGLNRLKVDPHAGVPRIVLASPSGSQQSVGTPNSIAVEGYNPGYTVSPINNPHFAGDRRARAWSGASGSNSNTNLNSAAARKRDTMDVFEDRLLAIKQQLANGLNVAVWDGMKNKQVDAVMKLEDSDHSFTAVGSSSIASSSSLKEYPYPRLVFQQKGSYKIFRNTLKPLTLDQNLMVQQGAKSLGSEVADGDLCVSLLRQPDGHSEPDRIVVLKLPDEEAQRDLYSGIRKLLTEATLRPREQPRYMATSNSPPGPQSPDHMIPLGSSSMHNNSSSSSSNNNGGSSMTAAIASAMQTLTSSSNSSSMGGTTALTAALERELMAQKEKTGRISLQMMEMTNDLNNKEEEARLLRQNLSTALDDMASLKEEYSTHKEVTAKFIRRIDMLQCEVDELHEENDVLKQTLRQQHQMQHQLQASLHQRRGSGSNSSSTHAPSSSSYNSPVPTHQSVAAAAGRSGSNTPSSQR